MNPKNRRSERLVPSDHRLCGLDPRGQTVTHTPAAPGHVAPNWRGGHTCMALPAVQLDAACELADIHKARSEIAARLHQHVEPSLACLLQIRSQMGCKLRQRFPEGLLAVVVLQ